MASRSQTYANIEHIVIDGASTDETQEVLRAAEETYPLRWVSEPDEGMYHAINKGLRMANGEILAYLNSDDLYLPWTLDVVVRAFEHHPEADFVFGDVVAIDDVSGERQVYLFPPFHLDHLRRVGFLAQPAVFWRRTAWQSLGGFDESLRYVADCDLWMRAGQSHRFHKVYEFLAVERIHAQTLREATEGGVWRELDDVRRRYVDFDGRLHQQRLRQYRYLSRFWRRLHFLAFTPQWVVAPLLGRGPWSRFISADEAGAPIWRLVGMQIPLLNRMVKPKVLNASRQWLEQ